jgi:hypothetical protein
LAVANSNIGYFRGIFFQADYLARRILGSIIVKEDNILRVQCEVFAYTWLSTFANASIEIQGHVPLGCSGYAELVVAGISDLFSASDVG